MQNKMRGLGQNVVSFVLNLVIVVLCVILVICGGLAVSGLRDAYSMTVTENSMYYRLDDGDFYRMVEGYHTNIQEGHEESAEMQEYYGVAKFYEAASMYKAFLETGDADRASRERERMNAARVEMGDWSMVEPEILKQLKINE